MSRFFILTIADRRYIMGLHIGRRSRRREGFLLMKNLHYCHKSNNYIPTRIRILLEL